MTGRSRKSAASTSAPPPVATASPSVFSILGNYRALIAWLVVLAIGANTLTLFLPKLISSAINAYTNRTLDLPLLMLQFGGLTAGIFLFASLQSVAQIYSSERVARDLRLQLVDKISRQSYRFIDDRNPSKLLTNITSDIDSVKMFVAQTVASLVSSAIIIIGTAIILLSIDRPLAFAVITIIPIIGITFFIIIRKVRALFLQSREVIDWLNKVINESILGSALIRVLNSKRFEHEKFNHANARARAIGIGILELFSFMIPVINFVSNMGTLIVVALGGYYVINGSLSLGSFAAFNSYVIILIFPILVIGFMSNIIAQADASYARINAILETPDEQAPGTITAPLNGRIDVKNVTVMYGTKYALQNASFSVMPGTKTAIIGPTAAGKTQLLNVISGLIAPQEGEVDYDGKPLASYAPTSFYPQLGLVFQDSILFNTTMRENIAFSATATDTSLQKAVETAELADFIQTLPQGFDTVVSERGTSLSGGQKQRIMLARALTLNPKILFLDDFTARVDARTERKILNNIERNYPGLTLISITQKIAPIETYDQIILLMEGEILARGTHKELMRTSPEYVQIYNSQRSTNAYELRA